MQVIARKNSLQWTMSITWCERWGKNSCESHSLLKKQEMCRSVANKLDIWSCLLVKLILVSIPPMTRSNVFTIDKYFSLLLMVGSVVGGVVRRANSRLGAEHQTTTQLLCCSSLVVRWDRIVPVCLLLKYCFCNYARLVCPDGFHGGYANAVTIWTQWRWRISIRQMFSCYNNFFCLCLLRYELTWRYVHQSSFFPLVVAEFYC